MTHIGVNELTIIGSDNGLSPGRRQAIIWTTVGILLIGPLGTNFSEMLIKIYTFSFKIMHSKMSSGKRRPFCLGLNMLTLVRYRQPFWMMSDRWPVSRETLKNNLLSSAMSLLKILHGFWSIRRSKCFVMTMYAFHTWYLPEQYLGNGGKTCRIILMVIRNQLDMSSQVGNTQLCACKNSI